ncbi:MAG: bifunctional nuclease family protein [Chitinophagaceae bacterium]
MSRQKIELEIMALSHTVTQSHSYAVVLNEVNGTRKLPIVIGSAEAQAIAVALENIPTGRPLTHDLMKNTMMAFSIHLDEVIIHRLHEGVFYAKLICHSAYETIEIDSRTSDALAMAVRFGAPIYTYEAILSAAGGSGNPQEIDDIPELDIDTNTNEPGNELANMSLAELNTLLEEVLEREDYIQAAMIRDEINKRR